MVQGYFLVYSDRKLALQTNLEKGEVSLPTKKLADTKKTSIIDAVKKVLKIHVEEFEILKQNESSLFVLIGNWEGRLSPESHLIRISWHNIRDSIKKIDDKKVCETLTFLKNTYTEVVSPADETMGIASVEETKNYNLTRRGAVILLKDDKDRFLVRDGDNFDSLLCNLALGESVEEAAYRLLGSEFGTLTGLKRSGTYKDYSKKSRYNMTILTGTYDESLTFSSETPKNGVFISSEKLKDMLMNPPKEGKTLSEGLKTALGAFSGMK